jgi:hypothetical protein
MQQDKFEIWAIVELFGHNKMAGLICEQQIAGANMVRVSVPDTAASPKFDRFLNPSSIYAINPVTEEVARGYAEQLQVKPINAWDAREVLKRIDDMKKLAAPKKEYDQDYEDRQREAEAELNGEDGLDV